MKRKGNNVKLENRGILFVCVYVFVLGWWKIMTLKYCTYFTILNLYRGKLLLFIFSNKINRIELIYFLN